MLEAIDFAKNEAASETAIDERDEASGQIIFVRGENGSKQIKAATIEKLVERLTDASNYHSTFQQAFLITFRSFMDCSTFFSRMSCEIINFSNGKQTEKKYG